MKKLIEKIGIRSPQLLVDNVLGHMDNMYTTMGKPIEKAFPLKQENFKIQDDAFNQWTYNIAYALTYLSSRKLLTPCLIYVVHLYILDFHLYSSSIYI
jgi:hypothetical protein